MSMLSRWNRPRKSSNGSNTPTRHGRGDDFDALMRPFNRLQNQINRVFDDFFDDAPINAASSQWMNRGLEGYRPRLDVSETNDAFLIEADVPGMDDSDIEVAVSDDMLTIRGERQEESHSDDGETDYVRRERSYGYFERRIGLPKGVDTEAIRARFKNGVLTVSLPKTGEAQGDWRTIDAERT